MIKQVSFSECDLRSPIFDSLIGDYVGFQEWFQRKSLEGATATIIEKNGEIEAFVYLKDENEEIRLEEKILPKVQRIKIGTFKTNSILKGQRYGEGLIGNTLRQWADSEAEEIYVTTFPKQESLIGMLKAYGFELAGEVENGDGEQLYLRSKKSVNFSDPKKSFPFIKAGKKGKYLLIDEKYHDTLFPQSELARGMNEALDLDVKNGVTKMYVSGIYNYNKLSIGDFMIVYRKSETTPKKYHSAATGVVVVENVEIVKENFRTKMDYNEFVNLLGNKTVLDEKTLQDYYNSRNCSVLTIVYSQFFGAGNNVNMNTLNESLLWTKEGQYPAQIDLSTKDLSEILELGGKNEKNVIIY
ncbi:hypothetical protein [Erysipelothrix anatis]|uniref:hypothetical protein n=1 Tax=Erysipelothrix anatis TaxID=2683713 RepID=UPI001358F62D|nr:hypothetical protein [Erysipelothrix anatis]